jgi:hypothetical protein
MYAYMWLSCLVSSPPKIEKLGFRGVKIKGRTILATMHALLLLVAFVIFVCSLSLKFEIYTVSFNPLGSRFLDFIIFLTSWVHLLYFATVFEQSKVLRVIVVILD